MNTVSETTYGEHKVRYMEPERYLKLENLDPPAVLIILGVLNYIFVYFVFPEMPGWFYAWMGAVSGFAIGYPIFVRNRSIKLLIEKGCDLEEVKKQFLFNFYFFKI